jgi:hypothetical protein
MMKKYILTEEQLNKVLNSKVTKGIGLKIQDNDGEYYKSIIKTFDTDREFKDWENNLKEGTTIIGVIDIDEPQPETISEGVKDKKKDKGLQMLERLMIKKYPFITKMDIGNKGDGYINLNIYFNLNEFYEITGTRPPAEYVRYHWWDVLGNKGYYLTRYVDVDDNKGIEIVNKVKDQLGEDLNKLYEKLPSDFRISEFEDMTDEELEANASGSSFSFSTLKRWQEEKKPILLFPNYFYPQIDVDKLLLTFSQEG